MRIDTPDRTALAILDTDTLLQRGCTSCDARDGRCRPSHAPEERDIMRFRSGTLAENWYVAALCREVSGKHPFAATIMEEPVVLFRGPDGAPR